MCFSSTKRKWACTVQNMGVIVDGKIEQCGMKFPVFLQEGVLCMLCTGLTTMTMYQKDNLPQGNPRGKTEDSPLPFTRDGDIISDNGQTIQLTQGLKWKDEAFPFQTGGAVHAKTSVIQPGCGNRLRPDAEVSRLKYNPCHR